MVEVIVGSNINRRSSAPDCSFLYFNNQNSLKPALAVRGGRSFRFVRSDGRLTLKHSSRERKTWFHLLFLIISRSGYWAGPFV